MFYYEHPIRVKVVYKLMHKVHLLNYVFLHFVPRLIRGKMSRPLFAAIPKWSKMLRDAFPAATVLLLSDAVHWQ